MGTRAVIAVRDDTGTEHRFYAQHASSLFQVQHLAAFIHDTLTAGRPLDAAAYRNWVAGHPGTLPGEDITGRHWYRSPAQPGDLEHWYILVLSAQRSTFRYLVLNRRHGVNRGGFITAADITTEQQLYHGAADAAEQLARHTEQDAAAQAGQIPGRPTAGQWRAHAATYHSWAAAAAAHAPARNQALASRVTRLLHRHHPDARIHTTALATGELAITLPAQLARQAPWLAHLIGNRTDTRYAVHIRYPSPAAASGSARAANAQATVTLRPVPAATGAQNQERSGPR